MPGKNYLIDVQEFKKIMNIIDEGICVVSGFRVIGFALSASRERKHTKSIGKARRDLIKKVCGASHACQEKQRFPFSTPVQVMQVNAVHVHKVACVRGMIYAYLLSVTHSVAWPPR